VFESKKDINNITQLPKTRSYDTVLYSNKQVSLSNLLLIDSTPWGGMSADKGIFLQATFAPTILMGIDKSSKGKWRIFSKLGAGYSDERNAGNRTNFFLSFLMFSRHSFLQKQNNN
jgi:hypothetical protein